MRRLPALCLIACLSCLPAAFPPPAQAQPSTAVQTPPAPVRLTAKQAQRELRILKRAFVDLHPGLYRYLTPEALDAGFARAEAEVADGSDAMQMYLIASRLAAMVRCGHTWTNPLNQGEAVQAQLAALPVLPFRVRLLEGRLLVTASADPAVPANAELLAIDGRTPATLVAELLPYLRADGSSDGKRLSQIDGDENGGAMDRLLPLLHPPGTDGYALRFRPRGGRTIEAVVAAMSVTDREAKLSAAGLAPEDENWRLDIDDRAGVAVLTLPTFAFWNGEFDGKAFLARSFDTLRERQIERLVLDLRRNEGGDDGLGDALQSYLLTAPFTVPASRVESAYERVPYDLARFLDTWNFGFFDRTGQVERGPGRNWVLREQPADKRIDPAAQPWRGRAVLLTGPKMSSAGYLIARNLKASGSAYLIGQPTGGNLRGLNGGQLAWLVLPTSGVSVDIPLIAAFPKTPQPDSGVTPDLVVRTTLEDVAAGRDPDMIAARRWLSRSAARR